MRKKAVISLVLLSLAAAGCGRQADSVTSSAAASLEEAASQDTPASGTLIEKIEWDADGDDDACWSEERAREVLAFDYKHVDARDHEWDERSKCIEGERVIVVARREIEESGCQRVDGDWQQQEHEVYRSVLDICLFVLELRPRFLSHLVEHDFRDEASGNLLPRE